MNSNHRFIKLFIVALIFAISCHVVSTAPRDSSGAVATGQLPDTTTTAGKSTNNRWSLFRLKPKTRNGIAVGKKPRLSVRRIIEMAKERLGNDASEQIVQFLFQVSPPTDSVSKYAKDLMTKKHSWLAIVYYLILQYGPRAKEFFVNALLAISHEGLKSEQARLRLTQIKTAAETHHGIVGDAFFNRIGMMYKKEIDRLNSQDFSTPPLGSSPHRNLRSAWTL